MSTIVQEGTVVEGLSVGAQSTSITGVTQHNALILMVSWVTATPPKAGPQLDSTAVAAGWLVAANPDGVVTDNPAWCTGSSIYYLLDAPAGTSAANVIFGDSTHAHSQIVEASGVATVRAFDQGGQTILPPSQHGLTVTSGVPTSATGIAFALCSAAALTGNSNNTLTAAPTGWTGISAFQDTNAYPCYSFSYALITSAVAQSATYTWGIGGEGAAVIVTFSSAPVAAPTLTSPTATNVKYDRVTVGASTNESTGSLYAVVYKGAAPNGAQVVAGQNGTFVPTFNANAPLSSTGAHTVDVLLLAADTDYSYAVAQQNVNGTSNVVTGTFRTLPTPPSISSVDSMSPRDGTTLSISGLRFGVTQGTGTLTLGGTTLSIVTWSDTLITATVALGLNKYGVSLDLIVSGQANGPSVPLTLTSVLPIAGWDFKDFGTPNSDSTKRLTSTPVDISSGDQGTFDTRGDLVALNADASFAADQTVDRFQYRIWSAGLGYGAVATETFGAGSGPVAAICGRAGGSISSVFGRAVGSISRFF